MILKLKFWMKCLRVVWDEREHRTCRNKLRRLARKFEKIRQEVGLEK
ncbi:hypothetical protein [Alkaliphilus metalliredigens]|nr:hypothetical protein [Alkaliphilus metalliredigens]